MVKNGLYFDFDTCRFQLDTGESAVEESEIGYPLSVILQITRRCNLSCDFCSETEVMLDPTYTDLERFKHNLQGVRRVYLSGGEPLLRKDLIDILDLFHGEFIVGLPTNAMNHSAITAELAERIDFANVGLDGPRSITSKVRGDYDQIMQGIRKLQELQVSISLSCVVLGTYREAVPYVCQIADVLEAKKVKLILPIRKGNALNLPEIDYLSSEETKSLFNSIRALKRQYGWKPKITLTEWTSEVEGYSVLVYPDGSTYAWPVYDKQDQVEYLGDLMHESIEILWKRNRPRFRANHLKKYLGTSIQIA